MGMDRTGMLRTVRDKMRRDGTGRPSVRNIPTQSLVNAATLFPQDSENVYKIKRKDSDVIRFRDMSSQMSSVKHSEGQDEMQQLTWIVLHDV